MSNQDVFNGLSSDWLYASMSSSGCVRVHTEKPERCPEGGMRFNKSTSCRRTDLDPDVINASFTGEIWQRSQPFIGAPPYATDGKGTALLPQPCVPAPACEVLTVAQVEDDELWQFAKAHELYVSVNPYGVVWFNEFKEGVKPRRAYDVEVVGVTRTIEQTRGAPQLAPPGPRFDNSPIPATAPVPDPFAAVLPFIRHAERYCLVGSRVTCNPPPLDTDQDVLVEVHSCNRIAMEDQMRQEGYTFEGSAPTDVATGLGDVMDPQRVFTSMRKGSMNYILTSDPDFYQRFTAATELAKRFNVLAKADRIAIFQAVLYGNVV